MLLSPFQSYSLTTVSFFTYVALPAAAATKLKETETIPRKWKTIKMNAAMLSDESMLAIRTWSTSDQEFLLNVSS